VAVSVFVASVNVNGLLIWKGPFSGSGPWGFYIPNSGGWTLAFDFNCVSGVNELLTTALVAGAWQRVMGTYDGTTGKIFINGAQVSTTINGGPNTGALLTSTGHVRLGQSDALTASWYLNGKLDAPALWNRALSAAEAAQDYEDNFARHRRRPWRLKAAAAAPSAKFRKTLSGLGTGTGKRQSIGVF
jgi:hypothetical protein